MRTRSFAAMLFARCHLSNRACPPALGLTALALGLAACGDAHSGREKSSSANGRTESNAPIEVLVTADGETLDPRYAVDVVGLRTTRLVHAGLTRLDPDTLEPRPYLARAWRWETPLVLRIELRENVRFHSGHLFDANDAVATLDALRSPTVHSNHARIVEPIADVRTDGPHVVVVTLKRPHATLLTDLELPILNAAEAFAPPDSRGTLDGAGPFVVARYERGLVELRPAEPGGPLPQPRHTVVLRTVHDENARALRLLAGRADVAINSISPTLLPALADGTPTDARSATALSVAARRGANLTYLLVDVERPPLADVLVRRALSAAIDRERITRGLFAGLARPAHTVIPPGHWAFTDAPPLPFDPARARERIAGAGLHLSLLTSTDRARIAVARFVAQELEEVGAQIDVIPLELGTLIARLNAGDFDLAILQIPELAEPNVLRVFLHSSYVPPAGSNRSRVRDAVVDALLDAGDGVIEQDARRSIYARLEARLREQLPIIPLWHEDQVAVTSGRARAFQPSAEGRWLSLAELP